MPALAGEYDRLAKIARSTAPVIVGGETGTGKEIVARAIHVASGRPGPFVGINCAALPAGLIESELFGHRRGAFSGAVADHDGAIRAADTGTLLLDELGELSPSAQAALLRVLQEHEVTPVGATSPIAVDLRIVVASHRDLAAMAAADTLRSDLYARCAGYTCTLPPLADRREDLGLAIAAALKRHARRDGTRLTIEAALRMFHDPWPLNLRAVDHAVERALALAGDQPIAVEHLPELAGPDARPVSDDELRQQLIGLLRTHRGNVSGVARELGKARMQIQRWLRRFALDPRAFAADADMTCHTCNTLQQVRRVAPPTSVHAHRELARPRSRPAACTSRPR